MVAGAMRKIIDSGDMSERVPVEYKDEIGQLSHTFNIMLEELGKAYENIKRYALSAKRRRNPGTEDQERLPALRAQARPGRGPGQSRAGPGRRQPGPAHPVLGYPGASPQSRRACGPTTWCPP
ncbi:MAG: HAMP domain-containing protein [Bacillus subtilis]|nr:HAMP domain-containing protein [Bacillus subtilis]